MTEIFLLSGGAAQGLVGSLAPRFQAEHGCTIAGTYGAVGAMRQRLEAGEPADLLILTRAIIDELARDDAVLADTVADVGAVDTAVAVRSGTPPPAVADADQLREALLAADEIFCPDPKLATAGIHFAGVLERLGIAEDVAGRIRVFPNGATAMRHLADSKAANPIGCTQVTEILSTEGAEMVAPLPLGYGLATTYTAAICTRARHADLAGRLIALLTDAETQGARHAAGFR
ncbi:MAG TPA: substrate-binding domain-containing protein [Afifellaceae bacterium]|nr:substrate-binding domain-containing protein [Afifellaceae bacterium]